MATIFRVHELRIVIYSNDHWPLHCHVVGPGCEAKIALGEESESPWVVTNHGLSRRQLAAALELIVERREQLRQSWRELHDRKAIH